MARERRATDGTEPLFPEPSGPVGTMQQAILDLLAEARRQGKLDDLHLGMAQLAVEAGRAIDRAGGDPYAFAQPARELREILNSLPLSVALPKGGKPRDAFDVLVDGLVPDGPGASTRD